MKVIFFFLFVVASFCLANTGACINYFSDDVLYERLKRESDFKETYFTSLEQVSLGLKERNDLVKQIYRKQQEFDSLEIQQENLQNSPFYRLTHNYSPTGSRQTQALLLAAGYNLNQMSQSLQSINFFLSELIFGLQGSRDIAHTETHHEKHDIQNISPYTDQAVNGNTAFDARASVPHFQPLSHLNHFYVRNSFPEVNGSDFKTEKYFVSGVDLDSKKRQLRISSIIYITSQVVFINNSQLTRYNVNMVLDTKLRTIVSRTVTPLNL